MSEIHSPAPGAALAVMKGSNHKEVTYDDESDPELEESIDNSPNRYNR